MDEETYMNVQYQLSTLAALVRDLPLAEFLLKIDRAEILGPIIDPTLYRAAYKNLSKIKRLAQGLIEFQIAIKEVMP